MLQHGSLVERMSELILLSGELGGAGARIPPLAAADVQQREDDGGQGADDDDDDEDDGAVRAAARRVVVGAVGAFVEICEDGFEGGGGLCKWEGCHGCVVWFGVLWLCMSVW